MEMIKFKRGDLVTKDGFTVSLENLESEDIGNEPLTTIEGKIYNTYTSYDGEWYVDGKSTDLNFHNDLIFNLKLFINIFRDVNNDEITLQPETFNSKSEAINAIEQFTKDNNYLVYLNTLETKISPILVK